MSARVIVPQVRVRAPGKVNLGLDVGPVGEDGYHPLTTIFQAVSVFEDLTARPSRGFSVTVSGIQSAKVPLDESNLALRAARLLAERTGVDDGVRLHIEKGVPVAGGMAGGSADAAAALIACDALWRTGLSRNEIMEIGAEIGSDVPFAVLGHTAVGVGRGDQLTPAMVRGQYHWVFAVTTHGLSTPEVFAEFDRGEPAEQPDPSHLEFIMQALRAGDPESLGSLLRNDLEEPACTLRPELGRIVRLAKREGALGAVVSGSGPTIAVLARSPQHAMDLSVVLSASGLVDDVIRAVGPVAGARVVEAVRGEAPPDPSGHRAEHPAGGEWRKRRGPLGPVD